MLDEGKNRENLSLLEEQTETSVELRREKRYPCVGITLLYSPAQNATVINFAECLVKAKMHNVSLSGLAFEVDREMQEGDRLVILIRQPDCDASARVMAEVRWCKQLLAKHYLIGVAIDAAVPITRDAPGKHVSDPIGKTTVPQELSVLCPACKKLVDFTYIGEQPVFAGVGIMPLYNCSRCGTTRSLTGIFFSQITPSKSRT